MIESDRVRAAIQQGQGGGGQVTGGVRRHRDAATDRIPGLFNAAGQGVPMIFAYLITLHDVKLTPLISLFSIFCAIYTILITYKDRRETK